MTEKLQGHDRGNFSGGIGVIDNDVGSELKSSGKRGVGVWDPVRNRWATITEDKDGLHIHPTSAESYPITVRDAQKNYHSRRDIPPPGVFDTAPTFIDDDSRLDFDPNEDD